MKTICAWLLMVSALLLTGTARRNRLQPPPRPISPPCCWATGAASIPTWSHG
ncbi:hypothetical protein LP419_08790 [Massilia sp. H-1]|nr:hypothetical protein LP419_08790 [Massilia sp. H-1]